MFHDGYICRICQGAHPSVACPTLAINQKPKPVLAPAVHILHNGRPLCGFATTVPAQWPEGHKWVGLEDRALCTCRGCKATAEVMT
jgi:hypothetical protein